MTVAQGYAYSQHEVDIGVVGRGDTIEAAFVAAARAVFSIQTGPDAARPRKRRAHPRT